MIRRTAVAAAVTALLAGLTFVNASTAAAAGELSPVMVVLDSSGSMTARDAGGSGTRMDAAKRAVGSMVDGLPAGAQVGLAIYGAGTGSSGAEKVAGCKDVRVVQPVGPVNKPALKRAVTATKASGYTPIGQALRTAAAQLPKEGQRSIVLVSDGEDTCAPPQPCEVAKELSKQGVDLHVHTIGFRVDAKARAQLACIAQNTGGTYHDASDADSLLGVLGRVTERALRHYEPTGKPVTGTADPFAAPALAPGQYLDTIDPVEERHYAAELKAGDTAYFAATAVLPRGNPRGIEVLDIRITGPDGADCYHRERELNTRGRDGGSLTTVLRWNGTVAGSSKPKGCSVPGKYVFRVTRDADGGGTDRVPIELQLRIEPPVTGSMGEPAQTSLVGFAQQPAGGVRAVRGGGSFNEATTLAGPGRYGETIYYGEELFYRVKLDWGQGLAYRITFAGRPDGATTNIRTALFSPVRAEIKVDTTAYTGSTQTLPTSGKPIATPRAVYLNRNADNSDFRKASVDGWYYIVAKLGVASGDAPAGGVPVTIDVAVAGDKVAGPEYGAATGETPGTPTPSASEPTPSESTPSESTPSGPATEAGGEVTPQPVADESSSTLPWIILGAVLVLAAAIVAAALILRRRKPPAPPTYPQGPPMQGWSNRP
ncbi:von Willebrand factor type A [Kribbella flavida DSM 17836]|uniref:von Willebrand factor type A n=1 Tax=Kribbella flavida (strain DSM 17836 / JCM 10339 / NBRC 14399) TaxID=479435 RepID=D2PMF8_KRIFD|nr:VWA domain-containing protein [Kribbella flavida]ADB30702.1 von Willebrand factor type A [Kribbella flavida DSM 17836]